MKVVLDSNVLLVSIPLKSKYRKIYNYFLNNKFELIISNEILNEYAEILAIKAGIFVSTNIIESTLKRSYYKFIKVYKKNDLHN